MSPHLISLHQAINSNASSDDVRKQVFLIKTECENVLRRQEMDFTHEKDKLSKKIKDLETQIQEGKIVKTGKQSKQATVDSEMNRLIEENQMLISQNEDLALEIS